MTIAVAVDELQRAWAAVEAGQFRGTGPRVRKPINDWSPSGRTVAVIGATGRVGATTVAVAIAEVASAPARVVECGPRHSSGLIATTTAEMGATPTGWHRGVRGDVLIERLERDVDEPATVPAPDATDRDLTIIDVSWDLGRVRRADSWLNTLVDAVPLVIVSIATVSGMRFLDQALRLTDRPDDTWCVIAGPTIKRWPKSLRAACTQRIDGAVTGGRLSHAPLLSSLAVIGLTPAPLPASLLSACAPVLDQVVGLTEGNEHDHL
ncbi:hypothetical protein [Aeromicrobium sp.]|uniref:hypothetical protein n=1 Tax=Aeromicrobium sp. TaxID=1871063 RepID=UPI0019B1C246|nr:hypothetical protein [Aeromicrobium sp.]MBC7632603.1 hypothetical protein [Aeromicrobium sp.]